MLNIAVGNSRQTKVWSNQKISYEDLCKRLMTPFRTYESAAEYPKLTRAERDALKDKGGFVGGVLLNGRRKVDAVRSRSMLVFDGDKVTPGFLEGIEDEIKYKGFYYTTHSHRPESPRVRISIIYSRDVTPEENNAIARLFAEEHGIISMIDPCSFLANQLMYWPTASSDGEYIFGQLKGEPLDPDVFLSSYPGWRDVSTLPAALGEKKAAARGGTKVKDPLEKKGLAGTFCRTFSIEDAIEKFLPDIYEPAGIEGRYTFKAGETTAGLIVYEGKFAYSHHATDPAGGELLNAFDLVRVHKFPDEDQRKSYAAMAAFAQEQDEIKVALSDEREKAAAEEFAGGGEIPEDDWKTKLRYMPRSSLLENSVWNLILILRSDPDFANFGYNELANKVEILGPVPWDRPEENSFWRDADTAQAKALIDVRYVPFSSRNHEVAFTKVADDRRFHPIRKYLKDLPEWDGIPRVEHLLTDYFGADDTPYVRDVTRKTLVAAVARIFKPGTKFDSVLILNGPQGIGKSTFFSKLAGDWFTDSLKLTDMKDKSAAENIQGFWIIELGELAGMRKADIESVKSFISRSDDDYRPSYGHTVESHPRQCIIVGSTNSETGYLRDITGNRRFWPVTVTGVSGKNSWDISEKETAQIWAEAVFYYHRGEVLYLEAGTEAASMALSEQTSAIEEDERQGLVEDYLETLLPVSWDDMDLYERRDYLQGDPLSVKGTVRRDTVTNHEIWCECFGRSRADLQPRDSYSIAAIMAKVKGWKRSGHSTRTKLYGKQRVYVRTVPSQDAFVQTDEKREHDG